jgi:hypothetical protein
MSKDDGSTLAEMLAALVVISLAIGGLSEGVYVIARHQTAASSLLDHATRTLTVQSELDRLMQTVSASELEGDANGFALACAAARTCSAAVTPQGDGLKFKNAFDEVTLDTPARGKLRFGYLTDDGIQGSWPPAIPFAQLRGVAIFDGSQLDGLPLAYAPIREQEAVKCEFDAISGDCRK